MNSESAVTARIIVILTCLIIITGLYFFLTAPSPDKKKYSKNKTDDIVRIGGEVELINLSGEGENTLIYKGRYRLVYFGFTYCPDICPTALNLMSGTINILNKYKIDVVPIFITIDPGRDIAKVLKPYLAHFNKNIIGYTGTDEQITKAAEQFKVYYAKVPRPEIGPNDYLLDHSSFFYFLDGDGQYIKHFPSTIAPEEMANSINTEIKTIQLSH